MGRRVGDLVGLEPAAQPKTIEIVAAISSVVGQLCLRQEQLKSVP